MLFLIEYEGIYLGGRAIVDAENASESLEILRWQKPEHLPTDVWLARLDRAEITELNQTGLIYHDDGDY